MTRILVTGATGNIGRHVVDRLMANDTAVRALTRKNQTALPSHAAVCTGDLTQPQTVAPALQWADRMFLFPVPETASQIVEMARQSGIDRIVALSCGSAGHGDEYHLSVERAVQNSGIEWVCLRPYGLMANALMWAETVRAESTVRAPHAGFTYPHVHEADIADVAVAALIDDRHVGETYTVSGPEAISQLEQVRHISEAIGRPVHFDELDEARTHQIYREMGWSTEAIELELFLLSEFVDTPAPLGQTVTDLLGQSPRTFARWAAEHADRFR